MSKQTFDVAIIGAGLGGLAAAIGVARAGHRVTIIERAPSLGEIGAGIQVPPNATRILDGWGLLDRMRLLAERPGAIRFRSYGDGQLLSGLDVEASGETRYGYPYLHMHRADYHAVLAQEVKRLGGIIQLNSEVTGIDFETPAVHIKDLPSVRADVIIGADGLKSVCRGALMGRHDPPIPSGDMAFRFVIKTHDLREYPALDKLASTSGMNYWIGPRAHAVTYKLRAGDLLNVVVACPDTLPDDINVATATSQEIHDTLKGWDPTLHALVELTKDASKWRLQTSHELDMWTHSSGKFTLLGDACHATLPYLAQGAALAIEDGAVLGHLFERIDHPAQIRDVFVTYEALRKPRTTRVVKACLLDRRTLHMTDGLLQKERDRQLRDEEPFEGYPNAWADPVLQHYLFSYDAHDEVDKAWKRYLSGRFPGTSGGWKYHVQPCL